MIKKRNRWLIGGVVIFGAVVCISMLNLGDNIVYFYTPEEALAKSADLVGKTIKVGALVKPESVKWQAETLSLTFVATDEKGNDLQVFHTGSPPDMFKEGQGVVVEGRLNDDGKSIKSTHLMVKHSEAYKKPEPGGRFDGELLKKSLFEGE